MEQNKIVCSLNAEGAIQAQVVLAGSKINMSETTRVKQTLVGKRGSLITDFAFEPIGDTTPDGLYAVTVTMPSVVLPEKQMKELLRFVDALKDLTGIDCTIDCSKLPTPKAPKVVHHIRTNEKKTH